MLISADVSQPIQKIIGIGYLMSADTINHIFGIGCTMSTDTNNLSGIRGVTCCRETLTCGEILVCTVRLPDFPTLYAAASHYADATSLYTAPSTPPPSVPLLPPSTPRRHCHRHQPHPLVTLPSALTLSAVFPSSSPTPSPSPTLSHRPRLLLRPHHSVLPARGVTSPWLNMINSILIPLSCNFFSRSPSAKNSRVKRAEPWSNLMMGDRSGSIPGCAK
jgi:hypothetical protein